MTSSFIPSVSAVVKENVFFTGVRRSAERLDNPADVVFRF
jgi:hypothetical protein